MGSDFSSPQTPFSSLSSPLFLKKKLWPHEARLVADSLELKMADQYAFAAAHQDLGTELGSDVKELAHGALTMIRDTILSSFSDDNIVGQEFDELCSLLEIEQWRDELVESGGYNQSVSKFVDDIIECLKLNFVMMAWLAEIASMDEEEHLQNMFPPKSDKRDYDIRRAISYAYLLQGITSRLGNEKKKESDEMENSKLFSYGMLKHFEKVRANTNWKKHWNSFEVMKITTIHRPFARVIVPMKTGDMKEYSVSSPWLYTFNIFEACFHDVLIGHDDNAAAGYETAVEPAMREPIAGLDNEQSFIYFKDSCVSSQKAPFPIAWNNLYQAWVFGVINQYSNWPMFICKLLIPIVQGSYHRIESGVYMYYRIIALWVHLHFMVMERVHLNCRDPPGLDWTNHTLTIMLGKVNRAVSDKYRMRVRNAIWKHHGLYGRTQFLCRRALMFCIWTPIKVMTLMYTFALRCKTPVAYGAAVADRNNESEGTFEMCTII